VKDWIGACKNKAMTITFMKTTKGRVCGGYLQTAWKETAVAEYGCDPFAFLFSVDHRLKLKPTNAKKAVYFNLGNGRGPYFRDSLAVCNYYMMNAADNCECSTNGTGSDGYNVPTDF
jgi:hypothetical protein